MEDQVTKVTRHRPTPERRRTVELLASYGVPQSYIAREIGVSAGTLRKYYRHELEHGLAAANAKVAEALFNTAVGGGPQSVTACIFWLKSRAGWTEKQKLEIENAGNGAPHDMERRINALLDQIAVAKQSLSGVGS
jgi:hypothetical protein